MSVSSPRPRSGRPKGSRKTEICSSRSPSCARSGLREWSQVAGLDLALELGDGALCSLQRRRERGRTARIELLLQATRRGTDLVEPRRRRELRRLAHGGPQRTRGLLGSLDSLGRLAFAQLG